MSKQSGLKKNRDSLKVYVQISLPLCALVFAIIFFMSRFLYENRNAAEESIRNLLVSEATTNALDIKNYLETVGTVGKVSLSIIRDNEEDANVIMKHISTIKRTYSEAYMVAVVDATGIGKCSVTNDTVDLRKCSYHSTSLSATTCSFVEDDGFTGQQAIVVATPIRQDGIYSGCIYLFVKPDKFEQYLTVEKVRKYLSVAIVDAEGNRLLINSRGDSVLNDDNLIESLKTASVQGTDLTCVKAGLKNNNKMSFRAVTDSTDETLAIAPIKVNDWNYIMSIEQTYINEMVQEDCRMAESMAKGLGVSLIVTVLLIVGIMIYNRVKLKEVNKDLETKADTDQLTGVYNKTATERKIQEFINDNPHTQNLLMLIDIDNFKKINDTMGHAFGDEVLKNIGRGLNAEFRSSDIIGRIGGDEYLVFLKNLPSDELLEREGEKLINFFNNLKTGDYVKYKATASIGAAVYPRDGEDFKSLYKAADNAVYEAKHRGKNRLVFYEKAYAVNEQKKNEDAKANPGKRD